MAPKNEGTLFDITEDLGTKPDGKKHWKALGRSYGRTDDTGGGLWEGLGEEQTTYFLVPHEGTSPTGGKTYDVMEKGSETPHGVLFIRAARNGGYYRVGSGAGEKEYAVFLRKAKPKAAEPADGADA